MNPAAYNNLTWWLVLINYADESVGGGEEADGETEWTVKNNLQVPPTENRKRDRQPETEVYWYNLIKVLCWITASVKPTLALEKLLLL